MTVYNEAGAVLAQGAGRIAEDGRTVAFTSVDDSGALLRYYFGWGGRRVTVAFGSARLTGWLRTRWDGTTRTWFLEVREAF